MDFIVNGITFILGSPNFKFDEYFLRRLFLNLEMSWRRNKSYFKYLFPKRIKKFILGNRYYIMLVIGMR